MRKQLITVFALIGMIAAGAKYSAKGAKAAAKATGHAGAKTARAAVWFAKNI